MPLYDVVILGAGSAGLWLAHDLAERNVSCLVIDEDPMANYSSTKNQGWVHSGALYVSYGQYDVAEVCRRGHKRILQFIREFSPESLVGSSRCYYMTKWEQTMDDLYQECKTRSISCRRVSIETLRRAEEFAPKRDVQFAARIDDRPVSTTLLLQSLVGRARQLGAGMFSFAGRLTDLQIQRQAKAWEVHLENRLRVQGKILVLCSGTLIPDILEKLGVEGAQQWFKRTRILVTVLHRPLFKSLLVVIPREETGAPNISPFYKDGTHAGSTVCLLGHDKTIHDARDFQTPDVLKSEAVNQLLEWYPGLRNYIRREIVPIHFYACQKIELSDRSPVGEASVGKRQAIVLDHLRSELGSVEGCFSFYPGKFTASPVVARELAVVIEARLEGGASRIARQPYLDPPTHQLGGSGSMLEPSSLQ